MESNELRNEPTWVVVTCARRDGRFAVRFAFPSSGRVINKILSAEQVAEYCGKDGYVVVGFHGYQHR